MAKRIADKELTDRNWDQEDEGEEAGTFSIASDDVLKNRPIKKAKRRNIGESENAGAFKGFKGFSLMSSGSSAAPTTGFSGFGNGAGFKGLAGLTNGSAGTPFGGFSSPVGTAPGLTFNGPASSSSSSTSADITTNGSAPSSTQSPSALGSGISGGGSSAVGNNKEYSRQLTALNCSVRDWIVKHVNGNPLCDLNPIFRDYEQHLASIERKYGATAAAAVAAADGGSHGNAPGEKQAGGALPASTSSSSSSAASSSSSSSSATSSSSAATAPSFSSPAGGAPMKTPAALFSFGRDAADKSPAGAAPIPAGVTFNFGQKLDGAALGSLAPVGGGAPPSFSFSASSSSAPGQGALFGAAGTTTTTTTSAAPFSFGGAKAEAAQPTTDENGEEESDEPPKPEVREIKEKDAFYSQRCKLFYKKDSEFKEKGVGTLHLKPTAEGRTQLVIRADTNLGNILLNIVLQASMPSSRMGKNNVVLACVPNPPVDTKSPTVPVPMLIRVKTSDDADALHKILEEKKA